MQVKGARFVSLYGEAGVNTDSNQKTDAENKKQEKRNYPGECNLREGGGERTSKTDFEGFQVKLGKELLYAAEMRREPW